MNIALDDILDNINTLKETEDQKNKLDNSTIDPRILRFKKGVKYIGRFIPTSKDQNTFETYEEIGFTSRTDGTYVYMGRAYADPALKYRGENIVNKTQWDAYKAAKAANDEAAMKETYKFFPQRKQMVRFLLLDVIGDDPAAKNDIGTVKVARYPASLDKEKNPKSSAFKAITEGLLGEGKKKIGAKGFLLPTTVKDGVNFVFDITDKGGFANYDSSQFDLLEKYETKIELTKDQVMEILNNPINLTELIPALKTQDELKQLLDQHWFGTSASADDEINEETNSLLNHTDGDDDIPFLESNSSQKTFDDELDELIK